MNDTKLVMEGIKVTTAGIGGTQSKDDPTPTTLEELEALFVQLRTSHFVLLASHNELVDDHDKLLKAHMRLLTAYNDNCKKIDGVLVDFDETLDMLTEKVAPATTDFLLDVKSIIGDPLSKKE